MDGSNMSRKTTRVAVSSPTKAPSSKRGHGKVSHLGLTVPTRINTLSRHLASKPVKVFDPEADYNYDSTDDEETPPKSTKRQELSPVILDNGAKMYQKICKKYGKLAVNGVVKQFGKSIISLEGMNLSRKELKAFFISLVESYINQDVLSEDDKETHLKQLNLGGNRLGSREVDYLIDFITAHMPLVTVKLNGCRLCARGMTNIASFARINKTLHTLDLSDNSLTDNHGVFISDIIENNEYIQELILRRNKLSECGAVLGEALGNNETLKVLDLSWNHFRGNGAIGLCKGLKKNSALQTLILAWNGFGFEGSTAMRDALAENTTLQSLDLSNNRIHPPGLFELIKGLEKNKALSSLKLGNNPITANMTSVMLMAIQKSPESNLKELDLEGVVVDKDFKEILEKMQETRLFIVRYDAALPLTKGSLSEVERKNAFNVDPIRILYYMKEHLRTIDLFLKFARDGSNSLTKEEMKYAFEMEGFPISDIALDTVMGYLATNKDGEVDLLILRFKLHNEVLIIEEILDDVEISEFINGERRLKRKLIKESEDELLMEKEKDQKYSQTFTAMKTPRKLPPLNGPKMS